MPGTDLRVRRAIAFSVALVLPLVLALEDGGYGLVARQEAGIAVWALLGAGFAFGFLPRARPSVASWIAMGAMAALVAFTALALGWSESDERTFAEVARVTGYLGFLVLGYLSINRYTARAAAGGLACAALAVPFLAVASRLAPDLLTDPAVRELGINRLSYPLGYWNALACWGAVAIAVGLVWSAHARARAFRALALAALPVAGFSVYLTYSRAGVVAVGVALLVALITSRRRSTVALHAAAAAAGATLAILVARGQPQIADATGSEGAPIVLLALVVASAGCAALAFGAAGSAIDRLRLPSRPVRLAVVGGTVFAVLLSLTVARGSIERGWDEFKNEGTPVSSGDPADRLSSLGSSRYEAWASALDAFESDAARGIGPGAYEFWWAREGSTPEFFKDAHSLYLEQLGELGVFGLILVLLAFGAALWAAVQARLRAERSVDVGTAAAAISAFVVFAAYAAVDWVWEIPALVFMGLGSVAVAGALQSRRWGSRKPSGLTIAGALVACAGAIAIQVPGLISTDRLQASAVELRAGDLDAARDQADASIDAQPFAAGPYVQRALVEEASGELGGARADLRDAMEREPTNWRHPLLLARIAARSGDRDEMLRNLEAARDLSPRAIYLVPNSPFLQQLDLLLAQKGGG